MTKHIFPQLQVTVTVVYRDSVVATQAQREEDEMVAAIEADELEDMLADYD